MAERSGIYVCRLVNSSLILICGVLSCILTGVLAVGAAMFFLPAIFFIILGIIGILSSTKMKKKCLTLEMIFSVAGLVTFIVVGFLNIYVFLLMIPIGITPILFVAWVLTIVNIVQVSIINRRERNDRPQNTRNQFVYTVPSGLINRTPTTPSNLNAREELPPSYDDTIRTTHQSANKCDSVQTPPSYSQAVAPPSYQDSVKYSNPT